jgi:IS5 family transposase
LENPYWQYFRGHEYFQHKFPLDPSSLVRWRNRVGAEGIEKLLKETIESAKRRLSKKALARQGRYAHATQMKRARKESKKLKVHLGRVMRDIQRKCPTPNAAIKNLLTLAERIFQSTAQNTNKVYSVHAPEVECISKGKAHKRYEFGCKVGMVTTSKEKIGFWGLMQSMGILTMGIP